MKTRRLYFKTRQVKWTYNREPWSKQLILVLAIAIILVFSSVRGKNHPSKIDASLRHTSVQP